VFIRRGWLVIRLIVALGVGAVSSTSRGSSPRLSFPPALVASGKISAADLLISAQKLLPKGAFLSPLLDDNYSIISFDWLQKRFLPSYRISVDQVKSVATQTGEGSDCDNYSMFLRQMINLAGIVGHTDEPTAAQVVVFQSKAFSGVSGTHERHEIGLFLTDRGWFVLEPQNGEELVPLDRYANRRSIQYITFH
jgi:hypothetical protein